MRTDASGLLASTSRPPLLVGELGVVAEDLRDIGDVPAALAHGLAGVPGLLDGECLEVAVEQAATRSRSAARSPVGGARPVGRIEGATSGGDRLLDLFVGCDVDLGDDRGVGRVDDLAAGAVAGRDPLTIDEQARHGIPQLRGYPSGGKRPRRPGRRQVTDPRAASRRRLRPMRAVSSTCPRYPSGRVSPVSPHLPEHPDRLWRHPEPKPSYDVVIIGGGGHGLAAAYYLAKNHGITNVAVVERGWLAGGNMARNTAIIRSNYLWDESAAIYEHALKLWEGLAEELDYDLLFSQRGVMNLAHNLGDVREGTRRVYANRLNGIDAEWLDARGRQAPLPDRRTSRPTSATRSSARPTSRAAASPSTTTSRGATRGPPTTSASTSSRTPR